MHGLRIFPGVPFADLTGPLNVTFGTQPGLQRGQFNASGAWNRNGYRGLVRASTVAAVGGAIWEGLDNRFRMAMQQGIDPRIISSHDEAALGRHSLSWAPRRRAFETSRDKSMTFGTCGESGGARRVAELRSLP